MVSYPWHISASQTLFSHRKIIYKINIKNKRKKDTLGLLNHRRIKKKYIKQRNHHSIFLNSSKKRRVVIGSFIDLRIIEPSFDERKGKKRKFHCRAVCNAHKMPVRLFNFLCFFVISPHHAKWKNLLYYIIRVMIHQPASSLYLTQTGEFVVEAEELLKLRETITGVYAQRTGKPIWVVSEDMERDAFMSATEAQVYGIVDHVAVQKQK